MSTAHLSVMLEPVLEIIAPHSEGRYLDLTLGAGGHSQGLLRGSAPHGQVIGIDRDPDALEIARGRLSSFGERFEAVHSDFASFPKVLAERGWDTVDGIVLDAGVSSMQLDQAERGFSFRFEAPLDMRMRHDGQTAAELIDTLEEKELIEILRVYGEVRGARRIAERIKEARAAGLLDTTTQLRELCAQHAHPSEKRRKVHPATRVFQALRIAVNDELRQLEVALEAMPTYLAPGGVAAVISFHSLEDRRVKRAFRAIARPQTPKHLRDLPLAPMTHDSGFELLKDRAPTDEEIQANPRARSARLRCLRRRGAKEDAR